jgi:transcription initiation factor IIF auxiliary subunit
MREVNDICVRHELQKKNGKILFKKFSSNGSEHFKIRIFLHGNIEQIESVDYELHSSFKKPCRHVENKESCFSLEIWTWGEFDINVTLYFMDGSIGEITYLLKYSNQLVAEADAYIDVS